MALDLSVDKLLEMRGKPVFDREGEKIGSIEDIYIDDETRQPEWLGLGTGFLGMKHAIVPLVDASLREDGIAVPYEKDKVKDAPESEGDDISAEKEAELARYYSIGTTQAARTETTGTTMSPGERTSTTPPAERTTLLKREEPVVEKSARAKEELHITKESEPTTERVTGELQKERVDIENDDSTPRP